MAAASVQVLRARDGAQGPRGAREASQVHVAWARPQARRASAQASGATTARSPPHKATCQKATCQKCTPSPLGTRRPMACRRRDGPACNPMRRCETSTRLLSVISVISVLWRRRAMHAFAALDAR
jgi:hypothetical protein